MYATGNKKMLNMLILGILRVYTDEDHSLTQQEIIKLLDKNNKLIAVDVSLSKEMVSTNELGNDMFTKCLDMIFRTIYKDTYNKQLEIIKNLNISLTMDGKKIY